MKKCAKCEMTSKWPLFNPQYTKPSSSTLFTKLGSSEDPMVFFLVISQLFDAVDYSNYVFWVSETIIQWFKRCYHQIFYVYLFQQK